MSRIAELCQQAHAAARRRAWPDVCALLLEADQTEALAATELELLARAAHLTGDDRTADECAARAFRAWLQRDEPVLAARRAAWLGLLLLLRGEEIHGGAWMNRATEALDAVDSDRQLPERGLVAAPEALALVGAGHADEALPVFESVLELGRRAGDPDVITMGQLGCGQALAALGSVDEAMACLDAAMVAVTADETSPEASGIVYCAVIETCEHVCDLRRARQWTAALSHWCDAQPGLVPYRGQCLVHRAQIMQLEGSWSQAADEAVHACDALRGHPAGGTAYYRLADLHRLRGRYEDAERCLREAGRWMADVEPAASLVKLARNRVGEAATALRLSLDRETGDVPRARLLAAAVEVFLAADDEAAARAAAVEIESIAGRLDAAQLHAMARHAAGACAVAAGDGSAEATLRAAWTAWRELDAPYEAARVRLLLGQAYLRAGEREQAEMELEAAAQVFDLLGAAPDLARARSLSLRQQPSGAGPLTGRELQVLRLVATGMTNRSIATELFLSEKTVARHLSSIFAKLGVSSRAGATAHAFQHDLL